MRKLIALAIFLAFPIISQASGIVTDTDYISAARACADGSAPKDMPASESAGHFRVNFGSDGVMELSMNNQSETIIGHYLVEGGRLYVYPSEFRNIKKSAKKAGAGAVVGSALISALVFINRWTPSVILDRLPTLISFDLIVQDDTVNLRAPLSKSQNDRQHVCNSPGYVDQIFEKGAARKFER